MDPAEKNVKLLKRVVERSTASLGGRSPYFRDYTAIIHSVPFRRLRHKTQVFFIPESDNVCTRLEHVLIVSSISMTIAKILGLDLDLAMAIGIGHDIGHPPFGHAGEDALSAMLPDGEYFHHDLHAIRVVDLIDKPLPDGLNLTYAVRDGISHHDGESTLYKLRPFSGEISEENLYRRDITPATPEGCVVRLSDRIAFICRDIMDSLYAGILKTDELPREPLHAMGCNDIRLDTMTQMNSLVIKYFVDDLIRATKANGNDEIGFSDEAIDKMNLLYEFSIDRIYKNELIIREREKVMDVIKGIYNKLSLLYDDYGLEPSGYKNHIEGIDPRHYVIGQLGLHIERNSHIYSPVRDEGKRKQQCLVDFIASFTDDEALRAYGDLTYPKRLI